MYQDHFQLKSQPFSEHAPATSLWVDGRMQEGLARLNYLVTGGTLGLVTGPTGAGKSALLKHFLHELSRQQCESVYCHFTHLNSTGLLKLVVSQLGEVPRRGKERLFEQILQRAGRTEGTLLLIIDEAHLLEGEALTDLRLLVSSAIDTAPPLKILLVGQETLRATLKQTQHQALLNRIQVRYRVKPLTKGSSPKSVGKKEMALNFLNRSSGSTKGVRPFHRHHHIVLTGVKTNAMAKTEGAQGSL